MKLRCILAGATLALTGAVAIAQSTAKPTPYEGTSQPPASDVIRSTESSPAVAPPTVAATPGLPAVTPRVVQQAPTPVPNPDYGIVEVPVTTEPGAPAQEPSLRDKYGRPYNPEDDIVNSVPTPDNALAKGTPIHTRLKRDLSSRENGVGTVFSAVVDEDVVQNGRVIIPTGSVLHGRVTHADYGRRIAGRASLRLLADEVVLPDGTRYNMSALPSMTARSTGTGVNGEGAILTRDNPRTLVAQYAIAGGAGAATGAVFGGPTGAIVGTGVGVGVITAHFLINRQVAVLPAGTSLTFGLKHAMQLNPLTTTALK